MVNVRAVPAATLLVLASLSTASYGESLHVSVLPTFIGADTDRGTDNSGFGVRAIYGWSSDEHWVWEAQAFYNVLETDKDDFTDFYQSGLGLDLRYNFSSDYGATPYVLAGLGLTRNDVVPDSNDKTAVFGNAGVGLVFKEFGDTRIKVRTEFRFLYDTFQDNYLDWQLGLGFEFPLR
ncbi:outer membrane beta-barrel protein [Gallaecimonas pentaromativorans]|uniref:outer membrane beta-barrel protein n=1 Tax=Gallaecimonas pentaromativorans TaxID=584787 RepID=UPI003A910AF1